MLNYDSENEFIEFKETTGESKEGVASMLNKNKHAILYFGITNKAHKTETW